MRTSQGRERNSKIEDGFSVVDGRWEIVVWIESTVVGQKEDVDALTVARGSDGCSAGLLVQTGGIACEPSCGRE